MSLRYLTEWTQVSFAAGMLTVASGCNAFAHSADRQTDFLAGFMHPLSGPDHILAMIAVGLWGIFLGPPAVFVLPIVFPAVMAGGGVIGILGIPLPAVEIVIAASAVAIGAMVALAGRPSLVTAAIMVGVFAVFHGYAHGLELPDTADALGYFAGFVVATGLLHLAGILFGSIARWPIGRIVVRAAGGAIALAGLAFLFTG